MSNKINDFRRRIEVIAEDMYPESKECWKVYRQRDHLYVVKVEDINTKQWGLFDFRETLTDDDIKERMKKINQKPEGEEE